MENPRRHSGGGSRPLRIDPPLAALPAAVHRAPRERRRHGCFEGHELDALEGALDGALADLDARGLLRAGDAGFERTRLRLAAVILCGAAEGERELAALRRAAVAALDPDPSRRAAF